MMSLVNYSWTSAYFLFGPPIFADLGGQYYRLLMHPPLSDLAFVPHLARLPYREQLRLLLRVQIA